MLTTNPNFVVFPKQSCKTCGSIPCMRNTDVIFRDLPEIARLYIAQLEARVAALEAKIDKLNCVIEQKDKRIAELETKCDRLQFQNAKLISEKYGSSSERVTTIDGVDLNTVDDLEPNPDYELSDAQIKAALDLIGAREQQAKQPVKKNQNNIRHKIPAHLPRVIDEVKLAKHERTCSCGGLMYEIGKLVSEKIQYTPARLEVVKYIRYKYGCRTCYEHVIKMPLPRMPIQKSYAHTSLLAHTIVSKYCDHLPLHRQTEIWKRQGVSDILNNRTMVDWMNQCGELLSPIVDCIRDKIIASNYARADESTIRVLYQDGKKMKSKGYFWLFMTGDKHNTYIVFEYHPTRSGEVANTFFNNFKGTLLVDGYSGYNALRLRDEIKVAGCNAHMRRKFTEIIKTTKRPGKAMDAINFIQQLYKIEDMAKDMSDLEKTKIRQLKAKPIWRSFKLWLQATQKTAPPKSPLGIAIGYALNHYKYLTHYLTDGRIDICNNWGENQFRPFVVGRKNWGMQTSSQGAKASAVLYSLAITCKARGINPFEYFTRALDVAPHCKSKQDWERLVPG